jgi:alkylation response protein AidB-like acyl-CoA dehydrogenase
VYAGISDRALELAIQSAKAKTSSMGDGAVASEDPSIRWQVADAGIALDALGPQLEMYASWVQGAEAPHPHWFRLLSGVKHNSVETARRVVDQAMRVAGGSGYRAGHELSRLQRDVLAGVYHPSDTEAVHRTVASDLLGPLA